MADKAWKRDERKVAEFFGTVRNPLSGINSKVTGSDTRDKRLYIENKRRKSHAVMNLLREVRKAAMSEEKLATVCLTEHNRVGFGILVHSDDIVWFAIEMCRRFVSIETLKRLLKEAKGGTRYTA